jgi:hypothetical protein
MLEVSFPDSISLRIVRGKVLRGQWVLRSGYPHCALHGAIAHPPTYQKHLRRNIPPTQHLGSDLGDLSPGQLLLVAMLQTISRPYILVRRGLVVGFELEVYRKSLILMLSNGSGGDIQAFIYRNRLLHMSVDWETTLESIFWIFDFILFFGFFIQSKTRGTRISENPVHDTLKHIQPISCR